MRSPASDRYGEHFSVAIYLDATLHEDFWERLAQYISENGWPDKNELVNLYPEIPRDENGWELGASSPR
jgi:peptide methionine sulfoxide reductase MsrB